MGRPATKPTKQKPQYTPTFKEPEKPQIPKEASLANSEFEINLLFIDIKVRFRDTKSIAAKVGRT